MTATQLLSRDALVAKLSPYKCELVSELDGGLELWKTGWDQPFTMTNEYGRYDFWQYQRVLAAVIAKTMPLDWYEQNGGHSA